MKDNNLEKIVAFCKSTGFIFPGSEIYGGLANTFDYGPFGVELKNNIKKAWWKKFVQEQNNIVGLDSAILMNPLVWEASGHLKTFHDPLMDCKNCKNRFRADHLIEKATNNKIDVNGWTTSQLEEYIEIEKIKCPNCGKHDFTKIREFNLMFKTFQGVVEDSQSTIYLRPETAQGIFVNFKNVQRTSRKKIPFGIGQVGKSFRNEITPGNFIFRVREFEQMELQFFCKPGTDDDWFKNWLDFCQDWLKDLGLSKNNLRLREHLKEELSFYSKETVDIEYKFSFGWGEIFGIANRTDYDLNAHQNASKKSLEYLDPETNEKYIPYVIEPSTSLERLMLSFLTDAYAEEEVEDDKRIVLHLHPYLAPIKACVLPLTKKQNESANAIYEMLRKKFNCEFDPSGSIGKRYRRQDEIGTPFCITVDFDTESDQAVTVRHRDSMEQERIKIADLISFIEKGILY